MIILGIESSCDETASSVVIDGTIVRSNVVSSQIEVHLPFGGVVPEVAARAHLNAIDRVAQRALQDAGLNSIHDIDAIAVTRGPGLIGALLVGTAYAKGLAVCSGKPLIPVNHVHAHVHGALLGAGHVDIDDVFPALALVVSGGHTNLYYMETCNSFELIGHSVDDACGECFDKVAKLLGYSYPGGPQIEKLAEGGDVKKYPMPISMPKRDNLNFSYSGLKTHMVQIIRELNIKEDLAMVKDLCAGFQDAALGQIKRKVENSLSLFPQSKSVLIAGGVAANNRLQNLLGQINHKHQIRFIFPSPQFCSDNAAMIASNAWFQWQGKKERISKSEFLGRIESDSPNWDAKPQYSTDF